MARPKDSVIEKALRRVVTHAFKKDGTITVKAARELVAKELDLERDFFHNAEGWKKKSKKVIEDAFEEAEPDVEEPTLVVKPVEQPSDSKFSKSKDANKSKNKDDAASTVAKLPTIDGSKKQIPELRVDSEDSSHEEDANNSGNVRKAAKKIEQPKPVNGVKRKADRQSDSSEDSESKDESSSEEDEEVQKGKKKARTDESSSAEESSDSGSEDESEKHSEAAQDSPVKPSHQVAAIPAKSFVPPSGFAPIAPGLLNAGTQLDLLDLKGKQIWHIVAPAGLPISSITETSLDALRSGQTILTHNGTDYILNEHDESTRNTSSLLLPAERGYKLAEQPIERSLHVQQKISLPNLTIRQADQNSGSAAAAEVRAPPISHVRPQPKGLRMRYKPPGSGPGRPGILGSSSETEDGPVNANAQTSLTQDVGAMAVDDGAPAETTKKSKKKRKLKDVEEPAQPMANGAVSKSPQSKTAIQAPAADGAPEETLSKEERKRLKRERKEARQKANG